MPLTGEASRTGGWKWHVAARFCQDHLCKMPPTEGVGGAMKEQQSTIGSDILRKKGLATNPNKSNVNGPFGAHRAHILSAMREAGIRHTLHSSIKHRFPARFCPGWWLIKRHSSLFTAASPLQDPSEDSGVNVFFSGGCIENSISATGPGVNVLSFGRNAIVLWVDQKNQWTHVYALWRLLEPRIVTVQRKTCISIFVDFFFYASFDQMNWHLHCVTILRWVSQQKWPKSLGKKVWSHWLLLELK